MRLTPNGRLEKKSGLASDIDTATVESLNALDPKRPIREAVSFNDPKATWLLASEQLRMDEKASLKGGIV